MRCRTMSKFVHSKFLKLTQLNEYLAIGISRYLCFFME